MKPTFSDAIAETRDAFLNLVQNTSATFYEVYSATPNGELEAAFNELYQGEKLLRFDVQEHSDEARARFCDLSDLERRAYDLPPIAKEKPLPYFGAFVPGIGHIGMAWTQSEICELINRTRQDEIRAKQVTEEIASRKE